MNLWFVLILLSLITYFVVQHNIRNITKTPVWLCWFVMMLPAFIWTAWTYFLGEENPIPLVVLLVPLLICPLLYSWLIQIGKPQVDKSLGFSKKTEIITETEQKTDKTKTTKNNIVRPINNQEEKALRDCFPWNVYYLQQIDYRPQAILCRGKLKTIPEQAYKKIEENIAQVFGDRFFVIFQESLQGKPFFALVPNPQAKVKDQAKTAANEVSNPGFAILLMFVTAITTTLAGVEISGIAPEQLQSDPNLIWQGATYSIALMLILGIHELGHYLAALYYKIQSSLPYFVPFPPTIFAGTLGAYTQRKSPIPHRQALFDVALSGIVTGLAVTIPVLLWGLAHSEVVPVATANVFDFDAVNPRFSCFLALLTKIALGSQFTPEMAINLHPVAVAGYLGLLIIAVHLMPVGQLDGGQIAHAVFGQRTAIAIGQIARILAILFALINPSFWIWTIILWFMPLLDQPALNDITELDNWRDFLGLAVLTLLLIIVLPLPITVANWLNI
ncbi:putative membrane-associated Zn-dependent protease [Xenococcus sp. PCC 7305]|uniref:site-2 protease family protein n=1 Tax=Xenococcus sp. PCC 7305 TaxID=102125 RepID=UPI0002ABB64A|nr:site-2 protease family protein [Xenococcus sp. PCC 7305]ELS03188.1 putative membrane-associated Zn-dependent protease [Xenococcus sp. PCC 7305]